MKLFLYYLIIAVIAFMDQMIKLIVVSQVNLFQKITLIPGVLDLTHIRNDGAAYNLFSQSTIILVLMPSAVMLAGLIYMGFAYKTKNPLLLIAIAMVIGGGLGNLIDRIAKGYVVDYFDSHLIPVFNVADIFICAGCGLLFIYLIFIDGKQHGKS